MKERIRFVQLRPEHTSDTRLLTFAVFALVVHGEVQQRQQVVVVQENLVSRLLKRHVNVCTAENTQCYNTPSFLGQPLARNLITVRRNKRKC